MQTLQNDGILVHDHVEPITREDWLRNELFEHHQNLGEEVLQVKVGVEVIYVHLVVILGHITEYREHYGNQITDEWIITFQVDWRLYDRP